MEKSGQFHATAALPPEKLFPVSIGWAPEPFGTQWRREISMFMPEIEPRSSNP